MLKSSLFDYSDAYIHVKGIITIPSKEAALAVLNSVNRKVIFKNWIKINDVEMPMYNFIEYSDIYQIEINDVEMPMYNFI